MFLILTNQLIRVEKNTRRRSEMNAMLDEIDAVFLFIPFKRRIFKVKIEKCIALLPPLFILSHRIANCNTF